MWAWAQRQAWWLLAAVTSFAAAGLGRLLDPAWLLGNGTACDTWFALGEEVLMGPTAHALLPFSRQTARVADFAPGGALYRIADVEVAQFLTAALWLAVTVVALATAARRLGGARAYWWTLGVALLSWPLYPAVSTDFVSRSVTAWIAVALFGLVLATPRRAVGTGIAVAALVFAMFTEPVVAPVVLGVLLALAVVAGRRAAAWVRMAWGGAVGVAAGLLILIALGNVTGSAPGLAVIDITWYRSMEYVGYSSATRDQWHSALWDLLLTSPLLGVVLVLSAPGAAALLVAARRRRLEMPTGQAAIHVANLTALVIAMALQSMGGTWLSAGDYYTAWFVPAALLSGVLAATRVRVPRPVPRPAAVTAGALAIVAAGAMLWMVSAAVVPPIVLVAWAVLVLLVMAIRVPVAPVVAMLVGAMVLVVLTAPSGFGDTAWTARRDPAAVASAPATLHRSVVDALSLVPAVGARGPILWWLSDPGDPVQATLPRGTVQCALSYPERIDSPLAAGWSGLYAGYLVGAPARVAVASDASAPTSIDIPAGQGLLAVMPPGTDGAAAARRVIRTLATSGVRAEPRGTVRLPGGQLVMGWSLTCGGHGRCRLRYAPAPG